MYLLKLSLVLCVLTNVNILTVSLPPRSSSTYGRGKQTQTPRFYIYYTYIHMYIVPGIICVSTNPYFVYVCFPFFYFKLVASFYCAVIGLCFLGILAQIASQLIPDVLTLKQVVNFMWVIHSQDRGAVLVSNVWILWSFGKTGK